MRLQTKGKDFSTDMSQDELERNNKLILIILQQCTALIHIINKSSWVNNNRRSQSNMEEGTTMDSSSYPSPSSSSEEDLRSADRSNDNNSTMARPDMVHRTQTSLIKKNIKLFSRQNTLLSIGSKARNGNRQARKTLRIYYLSKGIMDMILYEQRYNTQRRYYYAMEEHKKRSQITHYSTLNLISIKPYTITTEILAQLTSVNTQTSQVLQFLKGVSSILLFTFEIDLKNNLTFQLTKKAIQGHMIVKPKYEDSWNMGILFDYWGEKNRTEI
ncbi:MAG: hypothetical protein EZS28_021060 [Streblomastix strix]|uniref:Uncharacterized protein n=1 Tax=Streblomastix strix TaxID=222440 RepID=A0A5J4VLV6_9EUKA|nr:MAG: hypothetical protein EZS28_021060 [Streblomastix strix]